MATRSATRVSTADLGQDADVGEGRHPELDPVGFHLPLADDVHAELAPGGFHRLVDLAHRGFDAFGHLFRHDGAIGELVAGLLDDPQALLHLQQAHEIAVKISPWSPMGISKSQLG